MRPRRCLAWLAVVDLRIGVDETWCHDGVTRAEEVASWNKDATDAASVRGPSRASSEARTTTVCAIPHDDAKALRSSTVLNCSSVPRLFVSDRSVRTKCGLKHTMGLCNHFLF